MKRYFHTASNPLASAFHCGSEFNFLTLPDGSHIVCMFDSHFAPDPAWTELPHLLEGSPLPPAVVTAVGSLVSLPVNASTFQLARALAAQNPRFHP